MVSEYYPLPDIREGIKVQDFILTKSSGKSLEEEKKIFSKKTSQNVMISSFSINRN
ncbi:hypothetical protein [Paenibacillus sp. 2TAB19]|uniref:hypothetical protein n=1 Tax=Paenibacillus sp. 2TAB19 TaxID=3233003 RepID=UPI003F9507F3